MFSFVSVLKKELARFFTDRRMVLTMLLPGVLLYVLYSVMGGALGTQFEAGTSYVLAADNLPAEFRDPLVELGFVFSDETGQEAIAAVEEESFLDLYAVFPEDFVQKTAAGEGVPTVEVYCNSMGADSSLAYDIFVEFLSVYEDALANRFDVATTDLADETDLVAMVFSSMMPMLLLMLLFVGCMGAATESIAGEKERGTMATLLVTPAPRWHIAAGKICALAVVALVSGTVSAVGTIASLPKLMGGVGGDLITTAAYTPADYALLALVILPTTLFFVTLLACLSTFAKSVREAQNLATPVMFIVMFLGISTMFAGGASTNPLVGLIPVYNAAACMAGVFSFAVDPLQVTLCAVSNLCYAVLGALALAKMFASEKVMFSK